MTEPQEAKEVDTQELADLVSRLYDLAGRSDVAPEARSALLEAAHALRGELVTLVSQTLARDGAAIERTMQAIDAVHTDLARAEADVQAVTNVVGSVSRLTRSLDELVQVAAGVVSKV
jgi:hypothetical protein